MEGMDRGTEMVAEMGSEKAMGAIRGSEEGDFGAWRLYAGRLGKGQGM